MKIVLDTNVLGSALIEGDPLRETALRFLDAVDRGGHTVYLPTVVVAELGVAFLQTGSTAEWAAFMALLRQGQRYRSLPLDLDLADAAARIRSRHRLKLPDAIVAASAVSAGADLLVSDDPDLRKVKGVVNVKTVRRALAAVLAA